MKSLKKQVLNGRVMDTSDNLLPEVRVALLNSKTVTKTDGNGGFTLTLPVNIMFKPDRKGNIEYLNVDVEGHLGQTIPIKKMSFFDKSIDIKIKPNPVGKDNVGFSMRMGMDNVTGKLLRKFGPRKAGDYIEPEQYEKIFAEIDPDKVPKTTDRAWFYAYVPENVKKVKVCFFISLHGIGTIDNQLLRTFASENDIALIGFNGNPVQRGCFPVSSLDEPVRKLAKMIKHPELVDVPIITFGHSNGTGFATLYSSQRPNNVIAWISYHSGASYHLLFPNLEKVPGLVMHGHLDKYVKNGQNQTIKNLRKKRNAAVGMMMEGNVGHGPVNYNATWAFIIEFCKAAMRMRLNPDGTLKPVLIKEGWLGEIYDPIKGGQQKLPIASYSEFKGEKSIANWLPDETFATVWREYGKTNPKEAQNK